MSKTEIIITSFKKILSSFFYKSIVKIKRGEKIVSFTFDDVPESTFINTLPILNKYNIKGTYYVALSLMAKTNERTGLYYEEDLHKCLDSGHELGCHSYGHIHFYKTHNSASILNDLKLNQVTLKKISKETAFENFSYPFGEQTISAKKIASKLYSSCRGTDHGINVGRVDLNSLKTIKLYERKTSLSEIDKTLKSINKSGGWLIFYTHDVTDKFSPAGCSPLYLETVIKKCIDLGFEIKNIKETIDFFKQ
jgi:peptidoglycan/xylan/chitin deacetylase (PgdA/CDA1 family)